MIVNLSRELPQGWSWDRRWEWFARLMRDDEVLGEVAYHNGVWTGTLGGRVVMTSASLDVASAKETVMIQVVELARRTM